MRLATTVAIALLMTLPTSGQEPSTARIDSAAPEFSLTDHHARHHSLSDYRGKLVVLEWTNFDCPFVKKHYESGNIPRLQKRFTGKEVVWLSICSSAPGKQGHLDAATITARIKKHKAHQTAYLIDENGSVGRSYAAKTTPHLFVVDPDGILIYAGGIDDKPSTNKADLPSAHNHVAAALEEFLAKKPVSRKVTVPYGCSVKY